MIKLNCRHCWNFFLEVVSVKMNIELKPQNIYRFIFIILLLLKHYRYVQN